MQKVIYLVDDDNETRNILKLFLENSGYEVEAFENGEVLLDRFNEKSSDMVILDIMMPGKDGIEICSILRKQSSVPIIMLTAKDSELDYINGIINGCDDYLVKPFRPTILLMKIKAIFRRIEIDSQNLSLYRKNEILTFDKLALDQSKKELTYDNEVIKLTPMELKLMTFMLENPEKVQTKNDLLDGVWGNENAIESRVTDETIRRIRRKLAEKESNVTIKTMWGIGYKLVIVDQD